MIVCKWSFSDVRVYEVSPCTVAFDVDLNPIDWVKDEGIDKDMHNDCSLYIHLECPKAPDSGGHQKG